MQNPGVATTYPMAMGGANDLMNPRYRCLCQKMHVVLGAKVIGIAEVVACFLAYLSYVAKQGVGGTKFQLTGGIVTLILTAGIVALMFNGIKKEKSSYVLPHLILQLIEIIGLLVGAVVMFIFALVGGVITASTENTKQAEQAGIATAVLIAGAIIQAVGSAFGIWFFIVIYRLYQYLKEKEFSPAPVVQSYQAAPYQQQQIGVEAGKN